MKKQEARKNIKIGDSIFFKKKNFLGNKDSKIYRGKVIAIELEYNQIWYKVKDENNISGYTTVESSFVIRKV
jgi:hypothetical protein